jgi:hypothetical protein
MMTSLSSQERTMEAWHELVESFGLNITRFVQLHEGMRGVFEVVKV